MNRMTITAVVAFLLAATNMRAAENTVTFDNQSGEPALVKLSGPTSASVAVSAGERETVKAAAGRYAIKVRYGTQGNHRFSKGQEFEVKETTTATSATTITLHKVIGGNYGTSAITEVEFGQDEATSTTPPIPSPASFRKDDRVTLVRDEPLLFKQSLFRPGKKGEEFTVFVHQKESQKVYLWSKDANGRDIVLNVGEGAVGLIGASGRSPAAIPASAPEREVVPTKLSAAASDESWPIRTDKILMRPVASWLSFEVKSGQVIRKPSENHVFLYVLCEMKEGPKFKRDEQFSTRAPDAVLLSDNKTHVVAQEHSASEGAGGVRPFWVFVMREDDLTSFAKLSFQFKDLPAVPLPALKFFELEPGSEPRLVSAETAQMTLGMEGGEMGVTYSITPYGAKDWRYKMTGIDGRKLKMDQKGNVLSGGLKFVWVEQAYEIRDRNDRVIFRSSLRK